MPLHPPDMAVRDLVLGVDGDGERLDRRLIEMLDFVEWLVCVFHAAGCRLVRAYDSTSSGATRPTTSRFEPFRVLDAECGERRRRVVVDAEIECVLAPHVGTVSSAFERDRDCLKKAVETGNSDRHRRGRQHQTNRRELMRTDSTASTRPRRRTPSGRHVENAGSATLKSARYSRRSSARTTPTVRRAPPSGSRARVRTASTTRRRTPPTPKRSSDARAP